jgi:stearoyl-CoA desaturase (delta-9 desaturase)
MKDLTHNQKVKILQAFAWIGSIFTLTFYWNLQLFFCALFTGWLIHGLGLCVSMHRMITHRSFTPRNKFVKYFLCFLSTICTLGSVIAWPTTHRNHHKYTDTKKDPTYPHGSLWYTIKCLFYYFPTHDDYQGAMIVKDLVKDKDYAWFHRNYFNIILAYIIVLGIINPLYIGYFYCVAMIPVFIGIGWVSVLAHLPKLSFFGYKNYRIKDTSYNSHFWQLLTMGEGLHNNHHARPADWNTAKKWYEFDIASLFIRLFRR